MVATGLRLPAPEIPAGADQATLGQYLILTSLILAVGLAVLARNLAGRFVPRWLTLSFLVWIAFGVNNILEGAVFTSMSAASLFTVVLYFVASLLVGAIAAWLFPPQDRSARFSDIIKLFFSIKITFLDAQCLNRGVVQKDLMKGAMDDAHRLIPGNFIQQVSGELSMP